MYADDRTTDQIKADVRAFMARNGISLAVTFVPFSKSRNREEKTPSFNYLVSVVRKDKATKAFDYSMGCAHGVAYNDKKLGSRYCIMRTDAIKAECETGFSGRDGATGWMKDKAIKPEEAAVLSSLSLDAEALDAGCFKDWADNFGYSRDSREAESIYNACIAEALELRAVLGDVLMREMREVVQGY